MNIFRIRELLLLFLTIEKLKIVPIDFLIFQGHNIMKPLISIFNI
ncbi:hypothetical protein CY0110_26597 [Crocosphaera chwakensis CCY0110]|uniref:Uncharacterized protein n=1 Tax=Crocosphaera chwakensis CCY0110 TaxID=391612 RepID=A3ISP5_9CHRO|nr:hypothetical protein CY0110_26597 [Crocosphaera chwakensis CCY0110]